MFYPIVKRLFDMFFAALGLLFLLPGFILVALLIKLTDRGPVFYHQPRVGRFGRHFDIWKFRTMVVGAEKMGALVTQEKDPRMTRIGRVLRKSSATNRSF